MEFVNRTNLGTFRQDGAQIIHLYIIWSYHKDIRGGNIYTKNVLHNLLTNRLYLGEIAFKDNIYAGQHEAIISKELWEQVQSTHNKGIKRSQHYIQHGSLLKSKCFTADNIRFIPTYTRKSATIQFRYYACRQKKWNITAYQLENAVIHALQTASQKAELWKNSLLWNKKKTYTDWLSLCNSWQSLPLDTQYHISQRLIERITIHDDHLVIRLALTSIPQILEETNVGTAEIIDLLPSKAEYILSEHYLDIRYPLSFRRFGGKTLAVNEAGEPLERMHKVQHDMTLIQALTKSYRWNKMLDNGEVNSIKALAKSVNCTDSYISRMLRLMYLSPTIIQAIMAGTQPASLNLQRLIHKFPYSWKEQEALLLVNK